MSIALIANDKAPPHEVGERLTRETPEPIFCSTGGEVLHAPGTVAEADLVFLIHGTQDVVRAGDWTARMRGALGPHQRLVLCMPRVNAEASGLLRQLGAGQIINPAGDDARRVAERILGHLICGGRVRPYKFRKMWGATRSMRDLYARIEKHAPRKQSVLILGETGTGKELIAEALHAYSGGGGKDAERRAHAKWVKINCHEIPRDLLGSEIFGHAKGAFTGAHHRKGLIEEASDGGTVFIDEIGELEPNVQVTFLDVVDNKRFRPLGTNVVKPIDARLIFATNRDLQEMVANGTFREDLFERINVLVLKPPPLRERMADIPLLVRHFVKGWNKINGTSVTVGAGAVDELFRHEWRRNVRELQNVVFKAAGEVDEDEVITDVLMRESITKPAEYQPRRGNAIWLDPRTDTWQGVEHRAQAAYIRALAGVAENIDDAVKLSGIPRSTLYQLRNKHGIKSKWGSPEPD